jgi:hypothetical protein
MSIYVFNVKVIHFLETTTWFFPTSGHPSVTLHESILDIKIKMTDFRNVMPSKLVRLVYVYYETFVSHPRSPWSYESLSLELQILIIGDTEPKEHNVDSERNFKTCFFVSLIILCYWMKCRFDVTLTEILICLLWIMNLKGRYKTHDSHRGSEKNTI